MKKYNMQRILDMHTVRSVASAFVSVFIPIYLLYLGHDLQAVFIFLMVHHGTLLGASFIAMLLSNKVGLLNVLKIRFIFLLSYLYLLYDLQNDNALPIFVIAIVSGISEAFYWMPLNILFARYADVKKIAQNVSYLFVVPQFFTMFVPLLAGAIAGIWGFTLLFAIAFALNVGALWFIRNLSGEKTSVHFDFASWKNMYRKNKSFLTAEFFENIIEEVKGVIFPIFTYITLMNILDVGFVTTLISLATMFFTLIFGKFADTYDRHKLLRYASIALALLWCVAYFVQSAISFYVVSIILGLVLRAFLVPYKALFFLRAKDGDAQFLVLREVPVILARLVVFSLAIVFVEHLNILFLFTAIAVLYFVLFFQEKKLA